jgi:hypothetical protein
MKHLLFAILMLVAVTSSNLLAQSQLDFRPDDTVKTLLERQVGKSVELRMRSGEKLAGKLERVGDTMVHLSQLTGAEFYDAAVALDSISAVVVRAKAN